MIPSDLIDDEYDDSSSIARCCWFRQDADPEVEVNDEETLALDLSNFPITITVSQVRMREAAAIAP